jgi:Subtilase family
MKIPMSLRVCVSAAIALAAGSAVPAPVPSTAQVEQAGQSDMIVIMRDQMSDLSVARGATSARSTALALSQNSVVSHLQRVRARPVKSFASINAFVTSMTPAEKDELLASHPEVQSVVPDRVIRALPRKESKSAAAAPTAAASAGADLCGTLEPEALQLTNTAFSNLNTAQAQLVLDGNGQPVTGKGVKVAFLADGMDPNIAGFIRPDGSHVFFDYQDFTGDPAGTPTAGGEAFGDAASIAAQDMPKGKVLNFDISQFVAPSHPLPSPCNIHIRGMAPGASLMGLKVFSAGVTTTSNFLQAIEYAVAHDIDVINESFGGNPYFDSESDPITLANSAAVKAGVTVTVSSGDGGDNGTLGSPSTGPGVINVGATTSFRLYAQTGQGVIPLLPAKGFVSNNISPFSSGGFAQLSPRTVDVVAPGQDGWALCSTNVTLFEDCLDYNNNPTGIEDFGGTSESAPLTAGEAALVIQAYRSTHGGKDPSPALVKQIIMSSATDLGAPTSEQGAGLINSLAAVRTALSVNDGNGKPKPHGNSLLSSVGSVVITAEGNTHETESFKITNTGWGARKIVPSLQKLSAPVAGATINFQIDPATLPTFPNVAGAPRAYTTRKFTVPAGVEHLDVAISYLVSLTSSDTPIVYLSLVDPAGRQIQYSVPQGLSVGYGHVDVVKPVAGVYTAYIYTRASGVGSYTGPIQLTWAGEKFVTLGSVSPASVTIAPGASQTFTASFFTPSEPGDLAAGIRFETTDGIDTMPEIPVTIRTLVPIGPTGGSFSGVLTGGNGRAATGNSQTYEFDVPVGVKDMSLVVPVADNGYLLAGVLVDPQGMQLSVGANLDPFGAPQFGMQHFRNNPQPGRWHYVLVQTFTSSGNQTSLPFTARIAFNKAQVFAPDLPNSENTKLSASGKPVKVSIDVVNSGLLTGAFFADARLKASTFFALSQQPDCAAVTTLPGTCGEFILPTQVSKVSFTAKSSVPIQMDAYNFVGFAVGTDNPDLFGQKTAPNTVVATLTEPELPYGTWYVNPSEIGPYPAAGAPTKPVTMSAAVIMKAFDTAVSADSGDAWADLTFGTSTFNPAVIAPGEDGPIVLTITPDPSKVGKVVSGYVYIDTYNPNTGTGDEVVRLPYTYTVAP